MSPYILRLKPGFLISTITGTVHPCFSGYQEATVEAASGHASDVAERVCIHEVVTRLETEVVLGRGADIFYPPLSQDLIIINIILYFFIAFKACGSLAGIMTISPSFKPRVLPEIVISASPSRR